MLSKEDIARMEQDFFADGALTREDTKRIVDEYAKLHAENAALREQLAARDTVPGTPSDVFEKLLAAWGKRRDNEFSKLTTSGDRVGNTIEDCMVDVRNALHALKGGKHG